MFFRGSNKTDANISSKYESGKSFLKKRGNENFIKAHSLFLECSKKKHAASNCELARMYCHGLGVKSDLQKALRFAEQSFKQGYDDAAFDIGFINYGLGNHLTSYKYYEIAADNNMPQAVFNLALMNLEGQGVKKDIEKAITLFWKNTSLTNNNKASFYQLGIIYFDNTNIQNNYDKAKECLEKAADYGVDGAIRLGVIYEYGLSNNKVDMKKAVHWYKKAAESGDASGQYRLGSMYSRGLGVPQSHKLALTWYQKSAKQGSASGQYHLGLMYDSGEGVERDRPQATQLYKKAMEQNLPDAFYALGLSYYYGRGVNADKKKAEELMIQASEKGVVKAKTFLEVNLRPKAFYDTSTQNVDQPEHYNHDEENISHSRCPRCGKSSNYITIYQCRDCGCIFCNTCHGTNVSCPGRGCPVCDNGCGGRLE